MLETIRRVFKKEITCLDCVYCNKVTNGIVDHKQDGNYAVINDIYICTKNNGKDGWKHKKLLSFRPCELFCKD